MDYPGGLREEQITCVTNSNSMVSNYLGSAYITVTSEVRVPGGADQSKEIKTYMVAGPGATNVGVTMLVADTISPDAAPLTTTYAYDPYLRFPKKAEGSDQHNDSEEMRGVFQQGFLARQRIGLVVMRLASRKDSRRPG
jgi:hypothetical protein